MFFALLTDAQDAKTKKIGSVNETMMYVNGVFGKIRTHPTRNTSASFRKEALMRIGKGYFSNSLGKRTMASHCSPILPDLRPVKRKNCCIHVWN